MTFPFRLTLIVSAAVAFAGAAWPKRAGRWVPYWPVPVMVGAAAAGAADLTALVGIRASDLPNVALLVGVWAWLVVGFAGAAEVASGRSGYRDVRALIVPSLLAATGIAGLAHVARDDLARPALVASALLFLAAGVLLAASRLRVPGYRQTALAWPSALVFAALTADSSSLRSRSGFAEAQAEAALLVAAWGQAGLPVDRVDSIKSLGIEAPGVSAQGYRVAGHDVRIHLVAHGRSVPEGHLSPRVRMPSGSEGVTHLHYGSHIVAVCITDDARFAEYLEQVVDRLRALMQRSTRSRRPIRTASRAGR